MIKKLFVFAVIVVVMIVGCGSGSQKLPAPTEGEIVIVERIITFGAGADPGIKLSCKSAILDYDGRRVILEEVKQFGAFGGVSWIGDISIERNRIILKFPSDAEYNIWIGKQRHLLPKLVTSKTNK